MSTKKGIVLIGVGRWGINLLRNLLEHPHSNIVAIVDHSSTRLAECQAKFNLNPHKVIMVTDWQKVRLHPGIDGVVVATPATTHYDLIKDALELGYHVLAEKPLTLDPGECRQLTHLAVQQQKQLLVDHTYLFHPAIQQGKQVLDKAELGELRYGYASRTHLGPVRQDVNALWDLAIHDLAIFNYWLGETPIQVKAEGKVWLQSPQADLIWLTLTYPSGFEAVIHLCWLNPDKQRRLCVVGNQGSLIFDELATSEQLVKQQGYFYQEDGKFIPTGQVRESLSVAKVEPLQQVCDRFLTSLDSSIVDSTSGDLATELVSILSCLDLSLHQQGKVVKIPSNLSTNSK